MYDSPDDEQSASPRELGLPPGTYFTVGGPVDRVSAGLRISTSTLTEREITELMGVAPSKVSTWRDGRIVWRLHAADGPASLNDAVAEVLAKLPEDAVIWEKVHANCTADIFCGLFLERINRGFGLEPEVLEQLALRNLSIGFDIYYVGRGDSVT